MPFPVPTPEGPTPAAAERCLIVLGLGNDILTDDAIGLRVVSALEAELATPGVDFRQTTEMGLTLLDFLTGYPAAILVDSIQTGLQPPGFVHELDSAALKHLTGGTPHFLGVGETLALGQCLGEAMPTEVRILAIEVADPFTVGTGLSPAVEAALPGILRQVGEVVMALAGDRLGR